MRNIKKKIKVQKVEVTLYDKVKKEERVQTMTIPEVCKHPELPHNCVELDRKVLEEKEVTYSMTPAEFVANAKIEE